METQRPSNVQYIDKHDRTWQQHLHKIKQIQSYTAEGKVGYISSKKRFSTHFRWQYNNPQFYTLTLSSTLTGDQVVLEKNEKDIRITDTQGHYRTAENTETLLKEIIGIAIPLSQLTSWLKGQPNEQIDYHVGKNHLLADFFYFIENQLWTIDYLKYSTGSVPLPEDILLKNADQTLKIKVDSWKY
ncbi:lipoprotein insertase outer membrane protein LolB [Seminibacterium arietis]|uniref:Outer-membrane lipoprotein LolB n=1 Tax=Seminibacterium arietis TaxID=1173502 RepID=A0ABW3I931_9PAST